MLKACRNKVSALPEQTGLLLVAVSGGAGVKFTVIVVKALHLPPNVATTVYTPLAEGSTLVMIGFCSVDVNEAGPVHKNVTPAVESAE